MRDALEIGPTPAEENCESLGPNYDPGQARRECRAYVNQLLRQFGQPPEGAAFRVKGFAHDFGTYYEAVVSFDDACPESIEYAFRVENEAPGHWDDGARAELGLAPA